MWRHGGAPWERARNFVSSVESDESDVLGEIREGVGKYLNWANEAMGLKPENQGRMAEFDSPLFGRCFGRIQEVKANLYQISDHSVLKTPVVIPASWLVRIVDQEGDTK